MALLTLPRQAKLATTLFVGLVFGALAWGFVLGIANSQLEAEIDSKTQALADLKRRASSDGLATQRTPVQLAAVAAPTETVAASVLQQRILDLLAQAGCFVNMIQAEVTRETVSNDLRRLNVQMTFECSYAALQELLYAVETNVPFVFVDSLLARPATTTAPGVPAGDRLAVTLAVWSYWRDGEANAAGPSIR